MQVRSGHISTSGRPSGEEHWSLSSAGLAEEKRAKTTVQTVFTHFLIVPFYFVLNTVFCNGLLFHFTGLWILPPGARGIFSTGGGHAWRRWFTTGWTAGRSDTGCISGIAIASSVSSGIT